MKKLKLDLDALQVESFAATAPMDKAGTVLGRAGEYQPPEDDGGGWRSWFSNCYTEGTCIGPTFCCPATWHTCDPTCADSCPDWKCSL